MVLHQRINGRQFDSRVRLKDGSYFSHESIDKAMELIRKIERIAPEALGSIRGDILAGTHPERLPGRAVEDLRYTHALTARGLSPWFTAIFLNAVSEEGKVSDPRAEPVRQRSVYQISRGH